MRINNNLMAMNTHRQLGAAGANGAKSMEKLSSGFRINKAGDDAAGLAISEKMRAQVRGLNQASRNSQDGISMLQTAEGALGETQAILQRMRELATQAANDTNVGVDRGEIQKEINQLTSEINRIGNTTEFNTQKILKGSESATVTRPALKLDAVGTGILANGTYTTSGGATIPATGATVTLTAVADTVADESNGDTVTFNLQGQEIVLTFSKAGAASPTVNADGTAATVNLAAGVTTADDKATAIRTALGAAIAANANIDASAFTIGGAGAAVEITSIATGAETFINVTADSTDVINAAATFDTGSDVSYTASTATVAFGEFADANAVADLVGQGITINGKTVEFYDANDGVYKGNADFAVNINAALTGSVANANDNLVDAIAAQLSDKIEGVTLSSNGTGTLTVTATANGALGDGITLTDGVDVKAVTSAEVFTSKFQVGSNSGQSMEIQIKDMRSLALGVSGNEASTEAVAKNGVKAQFVALKSVSNGTDNTSTEYALDVSSHDKAQAAISVINDAIEKVSAQRSDLGSFQNRLEHTIKNLDTSSENLQAAESRIRDVDMAKEMMEFTKNNILQQAAQAMLAQANQAPQGVLQLLR